MKKFIIETTNERITAHTGLAIIGDLLYHTNLPQRLNQAKSGKIDRSSKISNGDVASSYIGLLCQGKSDFDHIEAFRDDEFFRYALNFDKVPSSPTLRQRLDQAALGIYRYSPLHHQGYWPPVRIAFKVIESTINRDGQILLVPEI